jgi:hypothetical protein
MSTLTIRISESKHARLRSLAKARGISINRLIGEVATSALTQHDTEIRFRALAGRGSRKRGLALLNKLDRGLQGKRKITMHAPYKSESSGARRETR